MFNLRDAKTEEFKIGNIFELSKKKGRKLGNNKKEPTMWLFWELSKHSISICPYVPLSKSLSAHRHHQFRGLYIILFHKRL